MLGFVSGGATFLNILKIFVKLFYFIWDKYLVGHSPPSAYYSVLPKYYNSEVNSKLLHTSFMFALLLTVDSNDNQNNDIQIVYNIYGIVKVMIILSIY